MPNTHSHQAAKLGLATIIAVFAALVALMAGQHADAHAANGYPSHHPMQAQGPRLSPKALRFHDQMRKLWEDHITWTRLAIVDLVAATPDTQPTVDRLLENQVDIGNAVKPFYGAAAGDQLTALLKQHILEAAAIIADAKAGDQQKLAQDQAAWYANADAISHFLAKANPKYWPYKAVDQMMHKHLDLTLKEAVDQLQGNYSASVADYDAVHLEILMMADSLSNGLIKQFPARFH